MTSPVTDLKQIQDKITKFLSETLHIPDEETFAEYILQLCQDEDMESEEKLTIMSEFLTDAIPPETSENLIQEGLLEILRLNQEYNEYLSHLKKQDEAEKLESQKLVEKAVLEESLSELTLDGNSPTDTKKKPALTREEMRQRERLLSRYGYDLDEVVENADGELEIVYKDRSEGGTNGAPTGLSRNDNAERVRMAEQAKKIKAQQAHQAQVQRNKELQEKQKLEKEKEKRRTQKKEKRRM